MENGKQLADLCFVKPVQSRDFLVIGADTDSIIIKKKDEKQFDEEERQKLLDEINTLTGEFIEWADDDYFKRILVLKTKNYVLDDGQKVKIKGSALKATTKEKALQRFLKEIIDLLLKDRKDHIFSLYYKYAQEVLALHDISEWCSKKTVTKAVLNPERTNERRVADALEDSEATEGDKVYMFYKTPTELCLREKFDGTYDVDTLLDKLYSTLTIFETVLHIDLYPNFTLQRNRELLGLQTKKKQVTTTPKQSHFPEGFWNTRATP